MKTIAKKQQGLEAKEELELKKRGLGVEAVFYETYQCKLKRRRKWKLRSEGKQVRKECRRHQVFGKSDSKEVRVMTGRDSLQRWAPTTTDHKNLD